jgi:hypothetical protein
MAKRDHLIPEVRTDKNGVPSVRYVKPQQAASWNTVPMPAPTFTPQPVETKVEQVADQLAKYVTSSVPEKYDRSFAFAVERLEGLPDIVIDEIVSKNNLSSRFGPLAIMLGNGSGTMPPDTIRDMLYLQPVTHYCVLDALGHDGVVAYAHALGTYDLEPIAPDGKYPDLRVKQIIALAVMTHGHETLITDGDIPSESIRYIENGFGEALSPVMTDERLVKLLLERPDEWKRIESYVEERRNFNTDGIMEYLDTDSEAMAEGVL